MGNVLKKYDEEKEKWQIVGGAVTGDTLPIGTIIAYGDYRIPTNWLACNGQAVSRTVYAELFSIIGTHFGEGDGSTTFNVPLLNNYSTPIGYDWIEDQGERANIGTVGGEEKHTMTVNELAKHKHITGADLNNLTNFTVVSGGTGAAQNYYVNNASGETGNSQPFNVMQPYVTTNYIIKAFQSAGVLANVVQTETTSNTDVYSCDYINSLKTEIAELQAKIDNSVAYCSMSLSGNTQYVDGPSTLVTQFAEPVSYGGFVASASDGYLFIPKGTEAIETTGLLCGSGYCGAQLRVIDDEQKEVIHFQKTGILVQMAGNGYWKIGLPTTIIPLDKTKNHYIKIAIGGYNGQTFTLNNGFGYTSSWFGAKKIK